MDNSPERLLIQIYKHLSASRNLAEQLIEHLGSHQSLSVDMPEDIQQLVQLAVKLSPSQRQELLSQLQRLNTDNK